jgi:hypothetical protein
MQQLSTAQGIKSEYKNEIAAPGEEDKLILPKIPQSTPFSQEQPLILPRITTQIHQTVSIPPKKS